MNFFYLFALLLVFPACVFVANAFNRWVIGQRRLHDQLLYSLCEVRDATALLSAQKVVPETSAAFQIFYTMTAGIIHTHRETGPCFHKLVSRIEDTVHNEGPVEDLTHKLEMQISVGPPELKQIANRFGRTIETIIRAAEPYLAARRTARKAKETQKVTESVRRAAGSWDVPAPLGLSFA